MDKTNERSEADALAQRIENRAAGRIDGLIKDAQGELEPKELWNKMFAGSVSEDGMVAAVDPEDLKNFAKLGRGAQTAAQAAGSSGMAIGQSATQSVCSPGANTTAVWYRLKVLGLCEHMGLLSLSSFQDNGELDDAVFKVAATFPMKMMEMGVTYEGPPFDFQEFVKRLEQARAE
jgi:hypothetical protein